MPHVVEQSQSWNYLLGTSFYMTTEIPCIWFISLQENFDLYINLCNYVCYITTGFFSIPPRLIHLLCVVLDLITEEEIYLQCLHSQCLEHSEPIVDPSLKVDNTHLESVITWKQRLWGGGSGVLHADRAWSFLGKKEMNKRCLYPQKWAWN